jgi:hypothetical protein
VRSATRLALAAALGAVVVAGVAVLRQSSGGGDGRGRVLMLDPRTGATLHDHALPGGYAIAEILARGRVAVASENGCPDHRGAWITVFDPSLQRVISEHSADPCAVAKLNVGDLRMQFEHSRGALPDYDGSKDVIVRTSAGRIVETYAHSNGGTWLSALTAYDAAGHILWKRGTFGQIGVVDVRGGHVILPVYGDFTLGSD